MNDPIEIREMLEPVDDTSEIKLPPQFADALGEVRTAIERCKQLSIPEDTVLAALLTELMPFLVNVYGPSKTASVLNQLADELSSLSEQLYQPH